MIPNSSLYPQQIDNNSSLFADPVNNLLLTLVSSISAQAAEIHVNEAVSFFDTPCFLVFENGEVVYATSKNNAQKIVTIERGATPSSHDAGESVRQSVAAEYFNQLKKALLAIENTLGVNPQGSYQTVVSRLQGIEGDISSANDNISSANANVSSANNNISSANNNVSSANSNVGSASSIQDSIDLDIADFDNFVSTSQYAIPAGTIIMSATPDANIPGYLPCDGASVSRETYAALFSAIGTTFGVGNGSTTFTLPDMRGRTPIGAGQGVGLTNRVLGQKLGSETHALLPSEIPLHTHNYAVPIADASYKVKSDAAGVAVLKNTSLSQMTTGDPPGAPHNNMQPSLPLSFFIKY